METMKMIRIVSFLKKKKKKINEKKKCRWRNVSEHLIANRKRKRKRKRKSNPTRTQLRTNQIECIESQYLV